MKKFSVAGAWVLFILLSVGPAIGAEPTEAVQVLFIGNSFTFYHDMPMMVATLAKAGKQRPLQFMQVTPGGYNLERHWNEGNALAAIRARKWDYVVLQDQSMGPIVNKKAMFEFASKFDEEIRKQGAKTLLYMTWAYADRPKDQAALTVAYTELGKELNAQVVPVGNAWAAALAADEKRLLHDQDKRHPNVAGSYLAACVFYASIYGKSPEGLPGRIGKLKNNEAAALQAIAEQAVRGTEE